MTKIINVKGAVQGVGFRPFVAELAVKYNIKGCVKNMGASVLIIAQGDDDNMDAFLFDIRNNNLAGAFIVDIKITEPEADDKVSEDILDDFRIISSSVENLSPAIPIFLPDIGICDTCMKEMLNPQDRRYRYPLISCAGCGPRISILNSLPYDRDSTSMDVFEMCSNCSSEYSRGRRHYAQTISCHDCGPQMLFKYQSDEYAEREETGDTAVNMAVSVLKNGGIIGLKGVSGYQLVCRPEILPAERLRLIKGRENKPFAIMYSDITGIEKDAYVSELERELLLSSARPIILLKKKRDYPEDVVKKSLYIGAFLPSSGIHRLLCDGAGPLIVTSANISDESIITSDDVFYSTFFSKVDGMCYHKRQINMPQDDSVVFVTREGDSESTHFIRRSRGYVPLPVFLDDKEFKDSGAGTVLAFGGDLKSTFSFGKRDRILTSQYIGDLGSNNINNSFDRLLDDYHSIFSLKETLVVSDLHPGYFSSGKAEEMSHRQNIKNIRLQHHFAHTYSVMAESSLKSAIGVVFDGTGYGTDGNIWGGEFLYLNGTDMSREGHLSYVKLVGGDAAAKNAGDVARCYSLESGAEPADPGDEADNNRLDILSKALLNNINTFNCSSMGRLFDAVSALLGAGCYNSYEGECAIALERAASVFLDNIEDDSSYPDLRFDIKCEDDCIIADQQGIFLQIKRFKESGDYSIGAIAYGFHRAVALLTRDICMMIRDKRGETKVCLSGGCFNNRILLEEITGLLSGADFEVYSNEKLPLGDGGISAGQAYYGLLSIIEKVKIKR